MKLAIHEREGSFSQRWIQFCENNQISHKVLDFYSTDIVQELEDCDIVLWHFHHNDYKDLLFAKQLLFSLEQAGKLVFPNSKTVWHFDDKLGQKFLLESLGLPLIPTYSFFKKKAALDWIENSTFPKVFKLRRGAGSANVQIVKNKSSAKRITKKAFSKGFPDFDGKSYFLGRYKKYQNGIISLKELLKSSLRLFIDRKYSNLFPTEKGYVYFQDFFPDQNGDIRIIVIGKKAFGIKRLVLKNDFRASGSGKILYDKEFFDKKTLSLAFKTARKLESQVCAIDFIYKKSDPYIVEISYGFNQIGYEDCKGYWSDDLNWIQGPFNPQEWIIENIIEQYDSENYK
jgi:glutathione synthase/RimK-type ligase-like ATP-grasp enzyme|tara:strand:- start:895 stop:1923 length:1029 start_codon:yes stop_codon:yes gene_type:complete